MYIAKHGNMEFYAEHGMIHVNYTSEKFKDDPTKIISIADWVKRMGALAQVLYVHPEYEVSTNSAERDEYRNIVEILKKAAIVLKEAQEQGDPMSKKVRQEWVKELPAHKYAMKPNIIIPGETDDIDTKKPELIIPSDNA